MGERVGYFSAYERGLECLLDMWPRIRDEVPGATLDIYYGWDVWDRVKGESGRSFKTRVIGKLAALEALGVTEHGRVSHERLAAAMRGIDVWAYPTECAEIHCITALKAQEAGCWPVVTSVGALPETVVRGDTLNIARIYSNRAGQREFARAVIAALREGRRAEPVPLTDWSDVAGRWIQVLESDGVRS